MKSLNKVMTHKEAECFRSLRKWQRVYLKQRFITAFIPRFRFIHTLKHTHAYVKALGYTLAALLSPLLISLWLLRILKAAIFFPVFYLATFAKPFGLHAPGERNIKGVHYQFARHIELPPELYLKCVDDWVRILYGPEKLPTYSITHYLNADYLLRTQTSYQDKLAMRDLIQRQISNAREELSNDLGHY